MRNKSTVIIFLYWRACLKRRHVYVAVWPFGRNYERFYKPFYNYIILWAMLNKLNAQTHSIHFWIRIPSMKLFCICFYVARSFCPNLSPCVSRVTCNVPSVILVSISFIRNFKLNQLLAQGNVVNVSECFSRPLTLCLS